MSANRSVFLCLLGFLLFQSGCVSENDTQTITVFAAASLTDVMEALADSFEANNTSVRVNVNVAATSLLARQIQQGAPADIFFSANAAWIEPLKGRVVGRVQYPLGNRLVVVQQTGASSIGSVKELAHVQRLALADPDHVPAGVYAKQALVCEQVWEIVEPHVVPMLDVRAALLSVRNGAADAAIVYASDLAATTQVEVVFEWPDACQPGIRYAAAQMTTSAHPKAAAAFLQFATGSESTLVWRRHGFDLLLSENKLDLQNN